MNSIVKIYYRLIHVFGPQHWWPAETPFEVMVGAILTQNTTWSNVEKAIVQLQRHHMMAPQALRDASDAKLASLIRPVGYFNIKAKRLKNLTRFFLNRYGGSPTRMMREQTHIMRSRLLEIHGVGPETADSILLYALQKPVFVVDAYTKRILSRCGCLALDATYEETQKLLMQSLKNDVQLFNEYHALLVKLGKDFCSKSKPRCCSCPLGATGEKILCKEAKK